MKKIILLSLLIVMAATTFATGLVRTAPALPGFWIKIEFSFYRPKKDCKSGFGICTDITAGIDGQNIRPGQDLCPARIRLTDRNELIIEVTEDALSKWENAAALPEFRGKRSVTIHDPYTLSPGTCRALGSSSPLTISPGTYPVSYENGTYSLVIRL